MLLNLPEHKLLAFHIYFYGITLRELLIKYFFRILNCRSTILVISGSCSAQFIHYDFIFASYDEVNY
jgi:hypothetical protein